MSKSRTKLIKYQVQEYEDGNIKKPFADRDKRVIKRIVRALKTKNVDLLGDYEDIE